MLESGAVVGKLLLLPQAFLAMSSIGSKQSSGHVRFWG
jgi:hypothetical protein